MGMHVPSPLDAGEQIPCACLVQPSASGRPHGKSPRPSPNGLSLMRQRWGTLRGKEQESA